MSVAASPSVGASAPTRSNWSPTPSFSPDDLIGAWEQGQQEGFERGRQAERTATERARHQMLEGNLRKAQEAAERMYASLHSLDLPCHKVFLRIEDLDRFGALFLMDSANLASDSFDRGYEVGSDVEQEVNSPEFEFTFSFMPLTDATDFECIAADGFGLRYPEAAEPASAEA